MQSRGRYSKLRITYHNAKMIIKSYYANRSRDITIYENRPM